MQAPDPKIHPFKFGYKLQQGKSSCIFATDSAEHFKKWFMLIRKFCILEKYNRKYKAISKLKTLDIQLGTNASFYLSVKFSDGLTYLTKIIEKKTLNNQ